MLKSILIFSRFFLFWLVFFFIERILFLSYFYERVSYLSLNEIMSTFWHALRLDSSMAAYISVIPALFYIFFLFFPTIKFPKSISKAYVLFFISLFSLLAISNLNLYREWGSKFNFRALDIAMSSPRETIAASSSSPILLLICLLIAYIITSAFIASKIIIYKTDTSLKSTASKIALSLTLISTLFLLIRGGWQLSPINQSMSYFSSEPVLNHAAVNTEWNLIQDIIDNKVGNQNPYQYYKPEDAAKIVASLFKKPIEPYTQVLDSNRPNIVLIIMESFTARFVEDLGGEKDVSPNFKKMVSQGLLFDNIYAAGGRTDKGVIAILSGFPAQAIRSIMKQNDKHEKLPSIAQELVKNGYSSSFYYGGESEFFNMKSYRLSHSYQKLVDKYAFKSQDMNSKWGAEFQGPAAPHGADPQFTDSDWRNMLGSIITLKQMRS